jgi:hypothetical protein
VHNRLVVAACGALLLLAGCSSAGAPPAGDAISGRPRLAAQPASSSTASAGSSPGTAASSAAPAAACPLFPADNVWHADVSHAPVLANSAALVAAIGAGAPVHADFGSGLYQGAPIGIPVTTVSGTQPKVKVTFGYAAESDAGPYPIPAGVAVEGGPTSTGDRHVLLYDPVACRDYELYAAYPGTGGAWKAGSGAIYDLRSNALRHAGWTSADAAGLPILPGLVRYPQVAAGRIDHAIRVTVPHTRNSYVWPARHQAGGQSAANLPPMGLRLRLKASVDISRLPSQARIVATAMARYGVIVADNGSPWYLSGTPDPGWNNDALHALATLTGNDFEAVDTTPLMVNPNSAATR